MPKTKIAFYSDLHTEFAFKLQSQLAIDNQKDLYIFAGDLCNLSCAKDFFRELRIKTDKPIIIVLGNHDFYDQEYEYALKQYRYFCNIYQITLLEQDIYINDEHKLIIFGATFWSDFEVNGQLDERAIIHAKSGIADFRYITMQEQGLFTPEQQRNIAKQTISKLAADFEKDKLSQQGYGNYTKIVISHFPPLSTLGNPIYANSILSPYFNPDYSALLDLADIWIYGHDHFNLRKCYENKKGHKTLILSNQHGYISERSHQRECPENTMPLEIDYQTVTQDFLDKMKVDFYPDICLKI